VVELDGQLREVLKKGLAEPGIPEGQFNIGLKAAHAVAGIVVLALEGKTE